jgi:hypothetical protein
MVRFSGQKRVPLLLGQIPPDELAGQIRQNRQRPPQTNRRIIADGGKIGLIRRKGYLDNGRCMPV